MKMKFNKKDEGELGIGTMIVFIALVLVAAIAAGLLVDSAQMMTQNGQTSSAKASNQVATGFKVFGVLADCNDPANYYVDQSNRYTQYVQYVYITVGLCAGSPRINMEDVAVEVVGPAGIATYKWDDTQADVVYFTGTEIVDPDGLWTDGAGSNHLMSANSIVKLKVLIDNATMTGLVNLTVGQSFTVRIIPKLGASISGTYTVPALISQRFHDLG